MRFFLIATTIPSIATNGLHRTQCDCDNITNSHAANVNKNKSQSQIAQYKRALKAEESATFSCKLLSAGCCSYFWRRSFFVFASILTLPMALHCTCSYTRASRIRDMRARLYFTPSEKKLKFEGICQGGLLQRHEYSIWFTRQTLRPRWELLISEYAPRCLRLHMALVYRRRSLWLMSKWWFIGSYLNITGRERRQGKSAGHTQPGYKIVTIHVYVV